MKTRLLHRKLRIATRHALALQQEFRRLRMLIRPLRRLWLLVLRLHHRHHLRLLELPQTLRQAPRHAWFFSYYLFSLNCPHCGLKEQSVPRRIEGSVARPHQYRTVPYIGFTPPARGSSPKNAIFLCRGLKSNPVSAGLEPSSCLWRE